MSSDASSPGRAAMRSSQRGRVIALLLGCAAIFASLLTVFVLSDETLGSDPRAVYGLVAVNSVVLLPLSVLVIHRIVRLWGDRRRGLAGSKLHVRLSLLFGVVAAAPTVIVAIFAALFLSLGLNSWFSERVRTALDESNAVATAYVEEHWNNIRSASLGMRDSINLSLLRFERPEDRTLFIINQLELGQFSEATVFTAQRQVLWHYGLAIPADIARLPAWMLTLARLNDLIQLDDERGEGIVSTPNTARALVSVGEAFLLVGRYVDQRVVEHAERNQQAVAAYANLEQRLFALQLNFAMIFVLVAMLLVLAAVWVGLILATRLVEPIGGLIAAAERVRAGDLSVRLADQSGDDELGLLSRAFNRMTSQLDAQRSALVAANRALDDRRRFTEAVLSGVSAGVVGLNAAGNINLPNRSASTLLGVDLDAQVGRSFAEIAPEMARLIEQARQTPDRLAQDELTIQRDGRTRRLTVRVTAERVQEGTIGFVVTFDDITDLELAQRKAAWADVARRIAHEIKNPLTPIQLSAERLKRKYLSEIRTDPEIFKMCTDTIVRQVGDIGRMVDEFSSFARMPVPVMQAEDLRTIVLEAIALQRSAGGDLDLESIVPDTRIPVLVDHRLVGQALTNLLQNAIDAIEGRDRPDGRALPRGRIVVSVAADHGRATVTVADNGRGLPNENRERLTEPYVTTRTKGTGLGLAIVKKIVEDHRGELQMNDNPGGGAIVSLSFAIHAPDAGAQEPAGKAIAHGA
jgi:two-component system, NtrC family, nitrogen regulation sensor histidine kinase NtrY